MNKTKRILALMLAVVMVFGMFPINAKADGETPETCEYCSVELTEGAEHAADCLTNCSCDPKPAEGEPHAEGCVLYAAADPADADDEDPEDEDTTEPSSEPTEPSSEPTEPSSEPTEPSSEPTEPSSEPTEPSESAGNITLEGSVDGTTFALAGSSIPEGAEAVIEKSDPAMLDALAGLGISGDSADLFDISVEVEGEKWQPGAAVMLLTADAEPVDNTISMTIEGLNVEAGQEVTIYHLFDEPNAIMNAYMAEKALELDVTGHEDMFEKELEAASYFEAGEGIIFYEVIEMVAAQDGMVTFDTQSFSTYVVASGNTLVGDYPWGGGFILNANHTYYVMPNTKMTLYTSDASWKHPNLTLGTARTWTVGTNKHGIQSPSDKAKSFTFYIKAGDEHIGETFKVTGGSYTATIKVVGKDTIVKQAISINAYDVYLTSVLNSYETLPGEPAITSAGRVILPSIGETAEGIIKESFATSPYLRVSTDGTSTLGIFDASGANITPHLNFTNTDWTNYLKAIIKKAKDDGNLAKLRAANGDYVTSATGYKLVPYVVKLQTGNGGASWNIDCYIVPTSSMITLQYDYNLPPNLSYSAGVPNTAVGASPISTKVASSPAAGNKTLKDPDDTSYYYVFKGWNTKADGTGTNYAPGDNIKITKNTTLYAKWVARYKYVLNYDFKGGSGSHTTQTKDYTEGLSSHTFTWTVADPTRTNYKFKGWSSNGDNTTVEIPAGTKKVTITGTAGRPKTTKLYAVWAPLYKYVLNFDWKGGSGGPSNITSAWLEASSNTFTWTAEPTKTGYTFAGWSTGDDNTPEILAGTKSYQVSGTAAGTKTTTLYACWTINQYDYEVKYLDIDTNAAVVDAITGKEVDSITGKSNYNTTVTGTREDFDNYTFVKVEPSTGSITIGVDKTKNVITYYYKENEVTISYQAVGPTGSGTVDLIDETIVPVTSASETIKVMHGTVKGAHAAIADNHYSFVGWYDDAACSGTPISTSADYVPTQSNGVWANKTYYAKFVENDATINYKVVDGIGGSVTPGSETLKVLTDPASGSTATVADGYRFLGWYSEEACTNRVSTELHYTPARPEDGWVDGTTYWAKFEEYTVPIHYQVVGPEGCGTVDLQDDDASTTAGRDVTETVPAATGNAVGATAEASSSNFKFVGWYSDEACTNQISTNAYYDPQKPDGIWVEKTYYAKFEYTVGHLTVSKTGIDALDHHVASGGNNQEQQTTVYTVKGTASNGTVVDLEVTIVGNSAITVYNIPVGTYTVTEKGSWSWRYDEAAADSKTATITGGETTSVDFSNVRKDAYWLSGDNFLRNLFTTITN